MHSSTAPDCLLIIFPTTTIIIIIVIRDHDDNVDGGCGDYAGDGDVDSDVDGDVDDDGVAHLGEAAGPLQPSLVSPTGCLTGAGQHLTKIIVVRMNNLDGEENDDENDLFDLVVD